MPPIRNTVHGTASVRAQNADHQERSDARSRLARSRYGPITRRVDYPAHSYLRSALAEMAPDTVTQIDLAAGEEAAE